MSPYRSCLPDVVTIHPIQRVLRWLLLGLSLSTPATALAAFLLQIADIDVPDLAVRDIALRLEADAKGDLSAELRIGRAHWNGLDGDFRDLNLHCTHLVWAWPRIECAAAELRIPDSPLGPQQVPASFAWHADQGLQIRFRDLRYAGGRIGGELHSDADGLDAGWEIAGLNLAKLAPLRSQLTALGIVDLSGAADLRGALHWRSHAPSQLQAELTVQGLNYADAEGLQVAEQAALKMKLQAELVDDSWRGTVDLGVSAGRVYSDPVYLEVGPEPWRLHSGLAWRPAGDLHLQDLTLDLPGMLAVHGALTLADHASVLRGATLDLTSADLARLYQSLAQPLLIGTQLDDLQLGGGARAHLEVADQTLQRVDLTLSGVDLDDKGGRFGVYGLNTDLHWRATDGDANSHVSFALAHLHRMDLGPATFDLHLDGSAVQLLRPARVPFYQGVIELRSLAGKGSATGQQWTMGLAVQDVALNPLTRALGWPPMSGNLNGDIPAVRYAGETVSVDGDLVIEVFDGRVVVRNLLLSEVLSVAPVFEADIDMRGMDLARLTEAFSFGRITGRLDGEVRDMQLIGWEPNRFRARFNSPPNDDLPHRISQRAVDNLTELGNGVSGALSSTFLRFFEDFAYDRLELSIRQDGGRAELYGIPHGTDGYYLVKGAWLPRIDVIGRNRSVAWRDLIDRLKGMRFEGAKFD